MHRLPGGEIGSWRKTRSLRTTLRQRFRLKPPSSFQAGTIRQQRILVLRLILLLFCTCYVSGFVAGSGPAMAKRVALVIGNDAYTAVTKLNKAVNDAKAMSETLQEIGYEVILATDVSRREMNERLQHFVSRLDPGDEALFFYAGHGVEVAGRNYLLPIDIPGAQPGQENFVTSESIPVDRVLEHVRGRGTRVSVLVLDACRNNPFAQNGSRGIGGTRGLARTVAPEGTFIMYSAGVGQLALDRLSDGDPHPNSVFTRSLIPLLKQPGISLVKTARQVRKDVQKLAGTISHDQRPAYYDEVTGDVYLAGLGNLRILPGDDVPEHNAIVPVIDPAAQAWGVIQSSNSRGVLEAFIKEFPEGIYFRFAKARLEEIKARPAADNIDTKTVRTMPAETASDIPVNPDPPGADSARNGKTKIALLTNSQDVEPPAATDFVLSAEDLAIRLQVELNRIGCSVGTPDGIWGRKSRAAIKAYGKSTGTNIVSLQPNAVLLRKLQSEDNRICPLVCSVLEVSVDGKCVAKTCGPNQRLSSRGKCYTPNSKSVKACPKGQRRNSKNSCYTPRSRSSGKIRSTSISRKQPRPVATSKSRAQRTAKPTRPTSGQSNRRKAVRTKCCSACINICQ